MMSTRQSRGAFRSTQPSSFNRTPRQRMVCMSAAAAFVLFFTLAASAQGKRRIYVSDAFGERIGVDVPVERIVVINSDAAEILCAFGLEDKIVGISDHIAEVGMNLLSGLKLKTVVGSTHDPSIEKIVELGPDVVISSQRSQARAAMETKLEHLGIPVLHIACYRIDDLESEIRLLGSITGEEETAGAYIAAFRAPLQMIDERLEEIKDPIRVYCEGYGAYGTVSGGSGGAMMLAHAGVSNIAANFSIPYPKISAEWVLIRNPAVIIKAAGAGYVKTGFGMTDPNPVASFWEDIMRRPGWQYIDAVKNKRVHLISAEIWCGPRAPVGILHVVKWCYPGLFSDIDPEDFHRQWVQRWHHRALNGIYVYP